MTPERHLRAKAIFLRVCEVAPDERPAAVERECDGDADLRDLVVALLAHYRWPGRGADGRATDRVRGIGRAAQLLVGQRLDDKYVVEARLGAGGMGEVYRARQLSLDRAVVVKVLASEPDPDALRRFEREARALARLNHPHVVTAYDLGIAADVGHYLVMEYVEGRTLRDELRRRGPLPVGEAVELMRQVCGGMAAAHAAGVVHRDLKPENVLLAGEGERTTAKVADFGLARLADSAGSDAESLTGPGAMMGTARYMSPEQCRGEEADERADVYAIGCVLYELLAGRPSFAAGSTLALLEKHRSEAPVPLGEARPEVPAALERVVARAMEKSRERRWKTAAEVCEALSRVANGDDAAEPAGALPAADADATRRGVRATPGNLTWPLTRCIGRERELGELAGLLGDERVRLVTITGTGGIGKTRVAVELAHALAPGFPDGVFQVDLASLSDHTLLARQIAEVFGAKESAAGPVAELLSQFLRERRLLLVLDNFEHLLAGAPLVARLLEAAPGLKALVTSQAPLRVRGEREYAIEALAVAAPDAALDELERSPAVALFVERAREARAAFALTAENARAVADVCRRLEGLPLAIELAAARVKLLEPGAILGRLERRLGLLTDGARDLPERQRTMRAAVSWSYELLAEEERALLRGLSVFSGGWTIEAAEAVCGRGGADVPGALGSLAEKSLLKPRDRGAGEARLGMLEVVREFALERLEAEGEAAAARLDHARYFLARALECERALGEEHASHVASLARDHENLSSALALLLEREPHDGVKMAVAVRNYWSLRNLFSEGIGWAERALASGAAAPAERVLLLAFVGGSEGLLGDHESAGARLREAIETARSLDDERALEHALHWGAINALTRPGGAAEGRVYLEEALEIALAAGDSETAASFCVNLSCAASLEGDRERVRSYTEEALRLCSRATTRATCLLNLGDIAIEEGDLAAATARVREALGVIAEYGDRSRAAYALESLAAIALTEHAPEKAARLAGAVDALYERSEGVRLYLTRENWDGSDAKLREALEPAAFEREWARGRAMTFDEAVAEALRDD